MLFGSATLFLQFSMQQTVSGTSAATHKLLEPDSIKQCQYLLALLPNALLSIYNCYDLFRFSHSKPHCWIDLGMDNAVSTFCSHDKNNAYGIVLKQSGANFFIIDFTVDHNDIVPLSNDSGFFLKIVTLNGTCHRNKLILTTNLVKKL